MEAMRLRLEIKDEVLPTDNTNLHEFMNTPFEELEKRVEALEEFRVKASREVLQRLRALEERVLDPDAEMVYALTKAKDDPPGNDGSPGELSMDGQKLIDDNIEELSKFPEPSDAAERAAKRIEKIVLSRGFRIEDWKKYRDIILDEMEGEG